MAAALLPCWLHSIIPAHSNRTLSPLVLHSHADTYIIRKDGVAIPGASAMQSGLLVGAGARIFALRLDKLDDIEAYFVCLRKVEPRVLYQDDIWFSVRCTIAV